jgi:hypothetical protein
MLDHDFLLLLYVDSVYFSGGISDDMSADVTKPSEQGVRLDRVLSSHPI